VAPGPIAWYAPAATVAPVLRSYGSAKEAKRWQVATPEQP
jgi:hypothetical protein